MKITSIRVSEEFWSFVNSKRKLGESVEATLRRLLGLPALGVEGAEGGAGAEQRAAIRAENERLYAKKIGKRDGSNN